MASFVRPVLLPAELLNRPSSLATLWPDVGHSDNVCCKQVPDYPSPPNQQQAEEYQQHFGVPQYPGPPPQYNRRVSSAGGGGLPTVVWVIVGAVIATIVSKVLGVVRSPGGVQGWVRQQCTPLCIFYDLYAAVAHACHILDTRSSPSVQLRLPSAHPHKSRLLQHHKHQQGHA